MPACSPSACATSKSVMDRVWSRKTTGPMAAVEVGGGAIKKLGLSQAMARDSTSLPTAQSASIAANIERSNRALAMAKLRFPECEKAMRKLVKEAH